MEPTICGHKRYGDRILSNQLAYSSDSTVFLCLAIFTGLVLAGGAFKIWKKIELARAWPTPRTAGVPPAALSGCRSVTRPTVLAAILLVLGLGWISQSGLLASEPKRFDIVVFQHEAEWNLPFSGGSARYIKRLAGLPGETITISGGDLFKRNKRTYHDEIIRKWESSSELQESLWHPVSKAWQESTHTQMSEQDRLLLEFPWYGAEADKAGVKRETHALILDGSAPVTLSYKYPITNICIKQGRWPFQHVNCPAEQQEESPHPKVMTAYVTHASKGVQCPRCKHVIFPVSVYSDQGSELRPLHTEDGASFFTEAAVLWVI